MVENKTLCIWCNAQFNEPALRLLRGELGTHRLLFSQQLEASNLAGGAADPLLTGADVAFGQPDPQFAMRCENVKWIHLTTAGYTRYDNQPFRAALQDRGGALTNSSQVYAEPCAEHVLAMMLAHHRQLLLCHETQRTTHDWPSLHRRSQSGLLAEATVVLLGFGAIGRRLTELLGPFGARVIVGSPGTELEFAL